MSDIQARINRGVAATGRNMHETKDNTPLIAAGTAYGRLIGVVEIGEQNETFQGNPVVKNKVMLTFELSGAKWPEMNGMRPTRSIQFTNSDSGRAQLHKLMKKLDPEARYNQIAQMIGQVFFVEIRHETSKRDPQRVFVRLGEISLPVMDDPSTGEKTNLSHKAAPQIARPMVFFWNAPTLEDWDDLYLPGEYEKGRTRNIFQHAIRTAVNFEGSPIWNLLEAEVGSPWADYDLDKDPPVEIPGSAASNKQQAEKDRMRYFRSGDGQDSASASAAGAGRARR